MKMNSQEFRQEIAAVLQSEGGAAAMLEQYFPGESEAILAGITRGMDAFTKQYATEIDKEAIVRDLDAHLEGKDIVAQMDYLLTMMTGLSAAASRGHGMNIWGDEIDVLQHFLDAVKEGIFDDQHPHIAQTLTEAKQLLVDTTLAVTDISSACGFSSLYHFCRYFKNKTGMTPTEYAKQNRIFQI